MKLPSRIVDLSSPLENETVYDPPFMRPKIEYRQQCRDRAAAGSSCFPACAWRICRTAKAGRSSRSSSPRITARIWTRRFISSRRSIDGKPMMTIDQVPLDWFFRPGVKLDFRNVPDGHVVTCGRGRGRAQAHRPRAQAVRYRAGQHAGVELNRHRRISHRRLRHGPRGDALSDIARRARHRHRCLGLGRAVLRIRASAGSKTHDPSIIWEGHKAGREIPYCHMEKLCNLEQLPDHGFTVACFPVQGESRLGRLDAGGGAVRLVRPAPLNRRWVRA